MKIDVAPECFMLAEAVRRNQGARSEDNISFVIRSKAGLSSDDSALWTRHHQQDVGFIFFAIFHPIFSFIFP